MAHGVAFNNSGGGVSDHGGLSGLADDDHSQYLNAARHAAAHSAGKWNLGTNQSITASTTTTVVFDTLVFEDDPDGDISYDTGTGVLTVNATGIYLFSVSLRLASASTNDATIVQLVNDAGTVSYGRQDLTDGDLGSGTPGINLCSIVSAAASDTFKVQVRHIDSASKNVVASTATFLAVARLL